MHTNRNPGHLMILLTIVLSPGCGNGSKSDPAPALTIANTLQLTVSGHSDDRPEWYAEDGWCNHTELGAGSQDKEGGGLMEASLRGGGREKAAVTLNSPADLSAVEALVMDVDSRLQQEVQATLLFRTFNDEAYETRPLAILPGWNRDLRFPLGSKDLKSSTGNPPWRDHNVDFASRDQVERITVLIYNKDQTGTIHFSGPRR